jgi:tetratricopeptide (TPR) repeat protein
MTLITMRLAVTILTAAFAAAATNPAPPDPDLVHARDIQDRAALEHFEVQAASDAQKLSRDAEAQYRVALASSYLAEVAIEVGDKARARSAAESGIQAGQRAVALNAQSAEFHRLLGTLCGQAVSSNPLSVLKYGHCAQDEINRAIELDPKSALNYVGRGVGNYYLPPAMGGGVDLAIKDFQKAIVLDAKLADAHLWLGVALRKAGRNADAHAELQKAADLAPGRVWAKQQLAKTPAQ